MAQASLTVWRSSSAKGLQSRTPLAHEIQGRCSRPRDLRYPQNRGWWFRHRPLRRFGSLRRDPGASFGPGSKIKILHWNPYGAGAPQPLLDAKVGDILAEFNLLVVSLWAAIQEAEKDLEETKGAVLVTGAGMSLETDIAVKAVLALGAATLVVPKSAQRKLVHIAHE